MRCLAKQCNVTPRVLQLTCWIINKNRDEQRNQHTTMQRNVKVSGKQVVSSGMYTPNSPSIKSYL